jgi:hypothetical protein
MEWAAWKPVNYHRAIFVSTTCGFTSSYAINVEKVEDQGESGSHHVGRVTALST